MENLRGLLSVVAAGYPEPMRSFLEGSIGLGSRFSIRVAFPHYADGELLDILRTMAAADDDSLPPEAGLRAVAWPAAERRPRAADCGNGRTVRGLPTEREARLATRTLSAGDEADLSTFQPEDVPDVTR